jgi:putative oxidoreductase
MADLEQYEDLAALVARLFMGALFVLYGYFKLTGYAGTVAYMGRQGLPAPALFAALAVIIELGGGLLILFGYQTRLVALGCAIYVLIAGAHRSSQFWRPQSDVALLEKHGDCRWVHRAYGRRRWFLLGGWAPGVDSITSARAHDGDDVAAAAAAAVRTFGGNGARYVALVRLVEGRRSAKDCLLQ